jgi:pimeloyl-ACP methyl ester carboxylesterase
LVFHRSLGQLNIAMVVNPANRAARDEPGNAAVTTTFAQPDGHKITYHTVGSARNPLMLFIVGSSGLGILYRRLALALSTHFQCVYYDKRGFLPADTAEAVAASQTNRFIPAQDNANDAAAIIERASPHRPAYVFGTSTGGTAVLDLTVRFPYLVQTAVLHEPITFSVMPPSELKEEVLALYRSLFFFEDQAQGYRVFADYMFRLHSQATSSALHESLRLQRRDQRGGGSPSRETSVPVRASTSVQAFNARQGEQEAAAMLAYEVDVEAARSVKGKFLLVRGRESREWPVSQAVEALARALGEDQKVWELVGDHLSFAGQRRVASFAEQLVGLLLLGDSVPFAEKERKARL